MPSHRKGVRRLALSVLVGVGAAWSLASAQGVESVEISNLRIELAKLEQDTLTLAIGVDFKNREPRQTNLWMIQVPPGGSQYSAWVCDLSDETMRAGAGTMSFVYEQPKFRVPRNKIVKFRLRVNGGYSNALDGEVTLP